MSRHLTDVSRPRSSAGTKSAPPGFGEALAQCALTWHQQPDEAAALGAITMDTTGLLRGADAAAVVTVSTTGTLRIKAAAGSIEKLHAALPRTLTPNLWTVNSASQPPQTTDRWPVSATLDHDAEMSSMICAPLGSGKVMFGTLLVLGFTTDAFPPTSAADATTLAIHASIALAIQRQRADWQDAIVSRDVIGQAKGILMHQRQLTADEAFTCLRRASSESNIKLRRVAETLCHTGELIERTSDPVT
ncbi:MAG: ANTAR domain-containing protein [Nakamurella sp.]